MEEGIFKLVSKHLELLLLEREESQDEVMKDLSPANLRSLERNGQALTKLYVANTICKSAGRYQIDLERTDGLPLEHGLSNGDLIICIRTREKNRIIRGIVVEISECSVSISSSDHYEDVGDEETFVIVKTDSDITFRIQSR